MISFSLVESASVGVSVFDVKGKLVLKKDYSALPAGNNYVDIAMSSLKSGIYFCSFNSGKYSKTSKMVIIR
jgi:hypothetical protein